MDRGVPRVDFGACVYLGVALAAVAVLWRVAGKEAYEGCPFASCDTDKVPAYVISLPRGKRSREDVKQRMDPVTFDFFDAVDGREVERPQNYSDKLMPGEVGCAMSHLALWEWVHSQDPKGPVLIFEDDVVLDKNFKGMLEEVMHLLDDNVDVVFLGHCFEREGKVWKRGKTVALHRSVTPRCTHAYLVTPRGLGRLVAWARGGNRMNLPVDEELRIMVQQGTLVSFSCYPPLAVQSGETSQIRGNQDDNT